MYQTDELEVWNLAPDVTAKIGAQTIFNVVGRLKSPEKTQRLFYCLNDGPEKEVFFNPGPKRLGRLENMGDFNIDTIDLESLSTKNQLGFRIVDHNSREKRFRLSFPCAWYEEKEPKFELCLDGVEHPQRIGQVVDGKWRVGCDERGERCLEIRREDAGLDRIILFGRYDWTTGYEVLTRLSVMAWTAVTHNVGLVFKWNPHAQGDGTHLPTQWSTGLGYYYSRSPGLRIRFGVNVHHDVNGNKIGDYIMKESPLSFWRWRAGQLGHALLNSILRLKYPFSQIVPGRQYYFRLRVHPERYALSVWQVDAREPQPQVEVQAPVERLPHGAVGIIPYNCGVRVYEFNVQPIK